MPAKLSKPVVRESSMIDERSRRALIVKLEDTMLRFRWKRTSNWYVVPLREIIAMGYRIRAQEEKEAAAEKKAQRHNDNQ